MTDHIGEATKKVIDLDALEKRLRKAKEGQAYRSVRHRHDAYQVSEPDIDAAVSLIAELKEAKEHLARCVELVPAPGAIEAADAFLARNGKGEG